MGVAADVLVGIEIGGRGQHDHDFVGLVHEQRFDRGPHPAAPDAGLQPGLVADLALDAEVIRALAREEKAVVPEGIHPEVVRGVVGVGLVPHAPQLGFEADHPRPVGADPEDDGLVGVGDEGFTDIMDAVADVRDPGDPGVHIQLAPVIGGRGLVGEIEHQIAQALVLLLFDRVAHQIPPEEMMRFDAAAGEKKIPDLGQLRRAALDHGRVGSARPIGFLVDLEPVGRDVPEIHRRHAAVADGQGVGPLVGRMIVPEERGRIDQSLAE